MHSEINQMSIKFQSRSNNEAFARQAVAAFAAQLDPTIEEINDIKTAVSEAVTNCIVHAYRDTLGYITVAAKLYDDGEIQIVENGDGKLVWRCPKCGNEDQDKMNVARRTCGYIGTQFWNQGRTQEIKERVLHL